MKKIAPSLLLSLLMVACVSTDSPQLSNGKGASFSVSGKNHEQIWRAATVAMSIDMTIVESHRPSGVIKSRVVRGTPGKVVGFFVQPTEETAPNYTITIVSNKLWQTDLVDRSWEPSVWEDFKAALGLRGAFFCSCSANSRLAGAPACRALSINVSRLRLRLNG